MVASRHAQINKAKNMKKAFFILTAALAIAACGNQPQKKAVEATFIGEETTVDGFALKVDGDTIKFTEAAFPVDEEGYIVIFDGSSLAGWRGYLRDTVTARWTIDEDGSLHFTGKGGGEAQSGDGGDIIFAHKFQNSREAIPASSTWPAKLLPPSRTAP